MANPVDEIICQQATWAERRGIRFDAAYRCNTLIDNLFMPLSRETAEEFGRGAGGELGTIDAPGSMASLRSSSAFAVNVFEPWRAADIAPLGAVLGSSDLLRRIQFEGQYPTGLGGVPPHLDVVVDSPTAAPVAIESKFTETYAPTRNEFRLSYFESPDLWRGFEEVRELALAVADGTADFSYLGAAQLIKHALGLKQAHGPDGFRLVYLWYFWPSAIADRHSAEVDQFAERVNSAFDFEALTYQELFGALGSLSEPRMGYAEYLEARYFSAV